jgi:hypothetical protein
VKPSVVNLGLSALAAFALAACARPVDMSLASLHQRTPEFDFLLYQEGWACLSQGAPEAAGSSCGSGTGRQLRGLFAQRSSSRSLREYLTANGASCRPSNTGTTCSYTKTVEPVRVFGRPAISSREEGVELVVSFPARDLSLTPEQIATTLRPFTRAL